jgi:hypothetical protein
MVAVMVKVVVVVLVWCCLGRVELWWTRIEY